MAHRRKYRYYTVACGETKGIFDEWEVCKRQVDHFKGNCYKGFNSFEDAVVFAREHMDEEENLLIKVQGKCETKQLKELDCMSRSA